MNGERAHRLREAVGLVLADVSASLGPGAVSVAVLSEADALADLSSGNPSLLEHLTDPRFGRLSEDVDAFAYVVGEPGAVGLFVYETEPFNSLVIRVADTIQDLVAESERFFGTAFPTCPIHHSHPLSPTEQGAGAVWRCPANHGCIVPIGGIAPT